MASLVLASISSMQFRVLSSSTLSKPLGVAFVNTRWAALAKIYSEVVCGSRLGLWNYCISLEVFLATSKPPGASNGLVLVGWKSLDIDPGFPLRLAKATAGQTSLSSTSWPQSGTSKRNTWNRMGFHQWIRNFGENDHPDSLPRQTATKTFLEMVAENGLIMEQNLHNIFEPYFTFKEVTIKYGTVFNFTYPCLHVCDRCPFPFLSPPRSTTVSCTALRIRRSCGSGLNPWRIHDRQTHSCQKVTRRTNTSNML